MPSTLTPLRYPGGKTKYAGLLADTIEMNGLNGCTFVEVFAGGAGAAISLLLNGHVQRLMLNDLDPAVYSFWRSVLENPEELVRLIHDTPVNITMWKKHKSVYDAKDVSDPLSLGFSTFYLNRCNHSGILGARPIGGMTQTGNYNIASRFNKSTSIRKIENIASHASAIKAFNLNALDFLRKVQSGRKSDRRLVYFDPPYYQKGPKLYLNHYKHSDHQLLRDAILSCSIPWVLSYDFHPEIRRLYEGQGCDLYTNRLRHTINGNTSTEELIVSRLQMPMYLHCIENRATRG